MTWTRRRSRTGGSGRPGWIRPPARVRRPGRFSAIAALVAAAATAVSACSTLGLDTAGPVDATIVTSAAPAAHVTTADDAVTVPTLQTGTTAPAAPPTPWKSLLTTSTTPTTSAPPLTAPTTTRTTLTFKTFSSVTAPTVNAPTQIATPPPDCFTDGNCKTLASGKSADGTIAVVNPPGDDHTIAVLTVSGKAVDALSFTRVTSPSVSCIGSHCLVQGSKSGVHFGNVVASGGGHLTAIPGSASSLTAMKLSGSGSSLLVAGAQRFTDYGLLGSDAPVAARTWSVSGGSLKSTGCGAPRLYAGAPAVTKAQTGSCSGTPRIAGYGSASAHKIASLGGFVTPSGNISCAIVSGALACTAKQHDFSVKTCTQSQTTVPKGLRGLLVRLTTAGKYGYNGCLGYTGSQIKAVAKKISYNRMAVGGGFICEVQESGVTCTAKSGKGFTLSRSAITAK